MEKTYKINKYPDGTSYVTIPKEWEDTYQRITFKINGYEDLWHLNQLCEIMNWNNVQGHIIIPCLLDSQADRRFGEFNSSGLTLIADLLNEYKGISFGIYHPHNPSVVEALFNRVECIDNSEFIGKVLSQITTEEKPFPVLVSPDAGAFKPLIETCNKLKYQGETFSCGKHRSNVRDVNGNYKLTQFIGKDDFEGKDILIVDDICVKGGTFKGLAKLLKERNCGKLYLAVSHMTLQELGEDPVTNYFDKVFVTNSKYEEYYFGNDIALIPENLEVIKMFN